MIGTVGKLLILVSFVAAAASGIAYFRGSYMDTRNRVWRKIARPAWTVMTVASISAFGILMYLSVTYQFQYAYIYDNTSLDLELKYRIAATWAGQEGSFLLWILLNALVGMVVMRLVRDFEAPVMAIIALCQVFLIGMIVGLNVGALDIGASPFATLAEKFPTAPMIQAGITPTDGQGLNDLLQNYWMVIHPPILFLGFSTMIVPFAFAVTALWKKRYTDWVRPALPWALIGVLCLGVGISLGGYWAYITLSFGGYWAWDPVENSSLVPWIVGIAALHTMIVQKRSGHSQKAALFLTILAYLLVIYSTFLTRSGVLSDISVHSFVDLGLYNQLLLWILTLAIIGFGLFWLRYNELPKPENEPEMLSREFMIFAGAMLLTAIAAVVILGTSAPIIGRLFRSDPSTVPLAFYNKWTLPIMVILVFLAGLGQLFWWNKMSVENVNKVLLKPIIFAVVCTIIVLLFTPFAERTASLSVAAAGSFETINRASVFGGLASFWNQHGMGILLLLLTFVAFFALFGNGTVLWRIARGNIRMAGGAFAHVGFAVMVLGIIASSGFSRPIVSNTGVQIGDSRDNFVLALHETRSINRYTVTYSGHGMSDEGHPTYELDFVDPSGRSFSVAPVVYKSSKGQWIQNPDVVTFIEKDLFVTVTPNLMFGEGSGSNGLQITVGRGDSTVIGENEYLIRFVDYKLDGNEAFHTDSTEVAVGATILVTNVATSETREINPVYLIMRDRSINFVPERIDEWGLSIAFTGMNVDNGSIHLDIQGATTGPEDWLVVQAYEKPFISLVWIGIIMFSFGFGIVIYRRSVDVRIANRRADRKAS